MSPSSYEVDVPNVTQYFAVNVTQVTLDWVHIRISLEVCLSSLFS